MLIMPGWAMLWNMFNPKSGWWQNSNYLLFGFGTAIMCLQIWMVIEGLLLWPRVKGVLEEALPPLEPARSPASMAVTAGAGAGGTN